MKKQMLWTLMGILVSSHLLTAQQPAEPASPADELAQQEAVRRQQSLMQARENYNLGQASLSKGQYDEAIKPLEAAYNGIPKIKSTEGEVRKMRETLLGAHARAGFIALKRNQLAEAEQHANRMDEIEKGNREAQKLLADIAVVKNRPPPPPPYNPDPNKVTTNEKFLQKQGEVKVLLRDGELALQSGQYELAEKKFQEVLVLDKYNGDAYRSLEVLHRMREKFFEDAKNSLTRERLADVSGAWLPVHRKIDVTQQTGPNKTDTSKISAKLKNIIIPKIDFNQATINEVIDTLREASRAEDKDPKEKGVNIILNLVAPPVVAAPVVPQPPDAPPVDVVPAPVGPVVPPITLKMTSVPLGTALDYITRSADLKLRIEPHAVVVTNEAVPVDLVTKIYKVNPGVFESVVFRSPAGAAAGAALPGEIERGLGETGPTVLTPADVKRFFTDAGVAFQPGASVSYSRSAVALIATNTREQLETIERILEVIDKTPPQVEIEARFVEVSQALLNELGFNWLLPNGIPLSINSHDFLLSNGVGAAAVPITQGLRDFTSLARNTVESLLAQQNAFLQAVSQSSSTVFGLSATNTTPAFSVVMKALAQNKSTDLLSAPKVTTTSGGTADIKIAREFIYPTEYTPATATAAGGGTTGGGAVAVVPATAGGFTTREIGVLLNVQPTVGEDQYTISLVIVPEVADFDGFINYGGTIQVPNGAATVSIDNPILQPIFSTRKVTTTLTIWDGQTVVMGGLIRDDRQQINDKVPFLGDVPVLGRLFRSKTTSITKRNLIIFVTASLVKPDGTLLHQPADESALPDISAAP